jgi:hypothetical protein
LQTASALRALPFQEWHLVLQLTFQTRSLNSYTWNEIFLTSRNPMASWELAFSQANAQGVPTIMDQLVSHDLFSTLILRKKTD